VFVPFLRLNGSKNLPDGNQLIIPRSGTVAGATPGADVYRSANAGSTLTKVDDATASWGGRDTPFARGIWDFEDLPGVYNFLQRSQNGTDFRVAYTEDGYSSLTPCAIQPANMNFVQEIKGLARANRNFMLVFGDGGASGTLQISTDRGASAWQSLTANLQTLWGGDRALYAQPL
jgi:hypothetical protein